MIASPYSELTTEHTQPQQKSRATQARLSLLLRCHAKERGILVSYNFPILFGATLGPVLTIVELALVVQLSDMASDQSTLFFGKCLEQIAEHSEFDKSLVVFIRAIPRRQNTEPHPS